MMGHKTMKRTLLLLSVVVATLIAASGVAFAVSKVCSSGSTQANPCSGTTGKDTLMGTNGPDYIKALAKADNISGGEGNDTTDGGSGNDTYSYKDEWGQDTLIDSSGVDALNFSAVGSAGVADDPISGGVFAELTPELGENYAQINGSNLVGRTDLSPGTVVEKVTGSSKHDIIQTGGAANTLQPGPGTGGASLRDFGGRSINAVSIPVSSDTYSSFAASGYGFVIISDHGGTADKLVLPFASTDVYFEAQDLDGFGAVDTLLMMTSSTDGVLIRGQLEPESGMKGHIEQIQLKDGTLSIGSENPSQTLSSAKAMGSAEARVAELNEASNLDAADKEKRSKAAKKLIDESKKKKMDNKEGSDSAKEKRK